MIAHILSISLRPSPGTRSTLALPVIAFALVTALMLPLIGGAQTFWTWNDEESFLYQALAMLALALLLVPLASLGGAAARLSARRRDERLSTLRLLGVTATTVRVVTVIESGALALLGAIAGSVLAFAVFPLIGLIPFRGEALGFTAVIPHPLAFVGVIVGITLLAIVSSALSLRAVVISPLGVRTRQDAPKLSWLRPVIAVGGTLIASVVVGAIGGLSSAPIVALLVLIACFAGTLAVLNLIGPWFLGVRARRSARRAGTAERLLAARRVTEDPRGAWRQVSGVAMASFMALFAGTGVSLASMMGSDTGDQEAMRLVTDMRTGVLITVLGSFLIVACAVGVSQAADILDRRTLASSLSMMGADASTIESSRRRAIMAPLIATSLASVIAAGVVVFPLVGIAMITAPATMLVIAAVLVLGCSTVCLGLTVTAPLQRSVIAAA